MRINNSNSLYKDKQETGYCDKLMQADKTLKPLQQEQSNAHKIIIERYSPLDDLSSDKPDEDLNTETIAEFKRVLDQRRQLAIKLLGE